MVGKEKKRRKLDEIVLGLSAAKGQTASSSKTAGGSSISLSLIQGDSRSQRSPQMEAKSPHPELGKKPPVPASITLTPAAPPSSSPAPAQSQKPFSITVTSVPSPQLPPKDFSAFLSQSLEQQQNLLMKHQKASASSSAMSQKKSYEAMIADINKVADLSNAKINLYSHEAKVNKWLAEQNAAVGASDALADYMAQRRRRRPEPSLDLKRLTGEEHVPVVHRLTGKRLNGPKAPQLKHLTQWIAENPMYDIDPKWTDSIKDSVKLSQESRPPRSASVAPSANPPERKKGRPPLIDSSSNVSTTMASNMGFGGLSASNLAGLNSSLLSGLSGLSGFDPKALASTLSNLANFDPKSLGGFDPKLLASLGGFDPKNPLLMPFGGMPNMLGNMSTSNMFANLAGLGLPGFSGMDMANLGMAASVADGGTSSSNNKSKSRKSNETHTSSGKSSAGNAASQFPFLFPNPGLLYPPLGMGGLNPFGSQSGMSSAYDALTQCGLINGSLGVSSASSTSHSNTSQTTSRTSGKVSTSRGPSVSSSTYTTSSRHQKSALDRQVQLQHLLLPHDTYLLESLSKGSSYDAVLKASEKARRDAEKRETDLTKTEKSKSSSESLRSRLPIEFTAVQEQLLKSAKWDKKETDISKILFEQMASGALSASLVSPGSSKRKDDSRDSFEKLSKSSAEFMSRTLEDQHASAIGLTQPREQMMEAENLIVETHKEKPARAEVVETPPARAPSPPLPPPPPPPSHSSNPNDNMDLEDLIAPSTIRAGGMVMEEEKQAQVPMSLVMTPLASAPPPEMEEKLNSPSHESKEEEGKGSAADGEDGGSEPSSQEHGDGKKNPNRKPRTRKQRDSGETEPSERKRELRSSAGRQAAAAAARAAAALRQERLQAPPS